MMKNRKIQKELKSIRENYSKGELVKEILKGLAIGGVIVASFALPNIAQILSLFGANNSKDRYRVNRAIQILKNKKLVNMYEKDGKNIVEITENGNKRVLAYAINEIKITRPKNWDGFWRVIVFDIPEKYKIARRALSAKLNDMEIYPLQKSVFICPFECRNEIDFICEFFNVKKYVKYILAKKIDDEEFLKRYYNL